MNILDPAFKYVPAAQTDIRKTFARIKREQKVALEAQAKADAEAKAKTVVLKKKA